MTDAAVSPEAEVRRARPGVLLAVVAAVGVAVAGGWWVTHPDRLEGVGNEVALAVQVGEPALIGAFAYPLSGSVVLRGVKARVREGSAAADVRVVFCAGPLGWAPLGTARGWAQDTCRETPPIDGQRLEMPSVHNEHGHLVIEIVPREPGEVVIDGLDVTYSDGLQRGTQAAGVSVRVEASRG